MKYDFETLVDRWEQGSAKWNAMKAINPEVPDGIVPLSVADMEFKNPPELLEGLKAYLDEVVLGYPAPTETFRQVVVDWIERRYGWSIQKDWLVFTQGVVTAFFHGVRCFSKEGDGVIVMTPVYYPFFGAVKQGKRELVTCPLHYENHTYTIDFALLEELAANPKNTAMIFCNPHNPVGRVWTKEELKKVYDICKKHKVFLISDEIHCDLILPGHHFTPMAAVAEEPEQLMVCYAPSKTFNLAGMQTSCIVIPNEREREQFAASMAETAQHGPGILGLKACEIAYTQCDAWLDELLAVLEENRRALKAFMEEKLPKIAVIDLEGTYLQWLDLRAYGFSKEKLEEIMTKEAFLFLDEGYLFGDEGIGFERVNIACPKKVLMEALERLYEALKKHEND
ncbi:MAG: MalY/PatB family protein [bacterium]|nr:MalY/PatB family protein [bacterium]